MDHTCVRVLAASSFLYIYRIICHFYDNKPQKNLILISSAFPSDSVKHRGAPVYRKDRQIPSLTPLVQGKRHFFLKPIILLVGTTNHNSASAASNPCKPIDCGLISNLGQVETNEAERITKLLLHLTPRLHLSQKLVGAKFLKNPQLH